MEEKKFLSSIKPDEIAEIKALHMEDTMRRRLLDIGLIEGTKILCVGRSPGGDPTAFLIRGAVIAIRKNDCDNIEIY